MAAIIVARHTTENRELMLEGEDFFPTHINLFGMPEEHIIRIYILTSHVIFNLLQEIKDDLEYQVYQNFLQPFIF